MENAIKYTEDDGNVKIITNIINEKVNDESICIRRVYASSPIVEIPEVIDGYIVREIGNYCFSSKKVDLSKAVLSCSSLGDL